MGQIISTKITRWNGGVVNDPRDPMENTCRMVTGFDILTNPHKMTPYRDSESGDSAPTTSQKQNFCIALRTGVTYCLFALGRQSALEKAEILMKSLTTGAQTDLDDNGWSTPNNNQSALTSPSYILFVYYKRTGLIYGAAGGNKLWAFDPTSATSWDDNVLNTDGNAITISYTNIAQGLVHSKDDILYIPYDNKIIKNNNKTWSLALTLPTHLYITSICEYGNYLAIACAPLSGVGNSIVYLWDRDSSLTTLSDTIDWGGGNIKVLEEINGFLVGISLSGNSETRLKNKVIFRYYAGTGGSHKFMVLEDEGTGTQTTQLAIAKQKLDQRIYFLISIYKNGARRDGVWSIGREEERFVLVHERTPNNDTAILVSGLKNFFFVDEYCFISYLDADGNFALSKTNDQSSHTATAIYETKKFDAGDASLKKDLVSITVMTEYLPAAGQVVLEYRVDHNTSWTNIFTTTTDNEISHSAVNSLPKAYKEIEFRIESTGGAEVTGLKFKEEIIGKDIYD